MKITKILLLSGSMLIASVSFAEVDNKKFCESVYKKIAKQEFMQSLAGMSEEEALSTLRSSTLYAKKSDSSKLNLEKKVVKSTTLTAEQLARKNKRFERRDKAMLKKCEAQSD